jgi:hypothetical protein
MKGFDVLNLMIKNVEDPVNEDDGEDMRDGEWNDEIVPFHGFY